MTSDSLYWNKGAWSSDPQISSRLRKNENYLQESKMFYRDIHFKFLRNDHLTLQCVIAGYETIFFIRSKKSCLSLKRYIFHIGSWLGLMKSWELWLIFVTLLEVSLLLWARLQGTRYEYLWFFFGPGGFDRTRSIKTYNQFYWRL